MPKGNRSNKPDGTTDRPLPATSPSTKKHNGIGSGRAAPSRGHRPTRV